MKNNRKKTILVSILLLFMIGMSIYFGVTKRSRLKEGVITVGITYDSYLLGDGGTLRYFFRTPEGIYTGTTATLNLKSPGYYYKIRYYPKDPSTCELFRDSMVADSIGVHFIKLDEISRSTVINGNQIPNWQWK